MAMTLVNSVKLRWTKPKVMPLNRYKLFTIFLVTPTQGLPFHCTVCHHLSQPTNHTSTPELNKVLFSRYLSGFNSLNWNVHILACHQWGDSRVWEQINFLKSTLLKLKYFVLQHWNSCISWQDHRKSVSAFLRFLDNQLTVSGEL